MTTTIDSMRQPQLIQDDTKAVRQTWRTPFPLFAGLAARYRFQIDAAADDSNHLLPTWLGPNEDAPECKWQIDGRPVPTWWNPPFGSCVRWVRAAVREAGTGTLSVGLVCSAINSAWFIDHAMPNCELWFFRGRVHYVAPPGIKKSSPDRDSMMMVFGGERRGKLGGVLCPHTGRILWRAP